MATVVSIVNGYGLGIDHMYCGNQPNKSKLEWYKALNLQ